MKITKRQLKKLIKEFRISKDYESLFDFDFGGGDLPPVEPPNGGGGGGGDGSGSKYPQVLINKLVSDSDKLVDDENFEFRSIIGVPEMCEAQLYSSDITVTGQNETSTVSIMFSFITDNSFLKDDLGETDIVDVASFECKDQQTVNDLYFGIMRMKKGLENKTHAELNRELDRLGSDFIGRYMLNANSGQGNEGL